MTINNTDSGSGSNINATRGSHNKAINFARKMFAEASQKTSKLDGLSTQVSQSGTFALYNKSDKLEVVEKAQGVVLTPSQSIQLEKRALFTFTYHNSVHLDIQDIADNDVDLMAVAGEKFRNSFARKMDETAIKALIDDDVHEYEPTSAGDAKQILSGGFDGTFSLNKKKRLNLYAKKPASAPGLELTKALGSIASSDLEDVRTIFGLRDVVDEEIYATLTPQLANILRKDSEFVNLESVFGNPQSRDAGVGASIFYKGIHFVAISASVVPKLNKISKTVDVITGGTTTTADITAAIELGSAVADEASAKPVLYTGDVVGDTTGANSPIALKSAAGGLKRGGTAAPGSASIIPIRTPEKADVVYFWSPSRLLCAKRADKTFAKMSDRRDLSHAEQSYWRADWGYMQVDDDYCLGLVLKGTQQGLGA